MNIKEKIDKYLNEISVSKLRKSKNKFPEQTPGKDAVNVKGEVIKGSIALDKSSIAIDDGSGFTIETSNSITGETYTLNFTKEARKYLKTWL